MLLDRLESIGSKEQISQTGSKSQHQTTELSRVVDYGDSVRIQGKTLGAD